MNDNTKINDQFCNIDNTCHRNRFKSRKYQLVKRIVIIVITAVAITRSIGCSKSNIGNTGVNGQILDMVAVMAMVVLIELVVLAIVKVTAATIIVIVTTDEARIANYHNNNTNNNNNCSNICSSSSGSSNNATTTTTTTATTTTTTTTSTTSATTTTTMSAPTSTFLRFHVVYILSTHGASVFLCILHTPHMTLVIILVFMTAILVAIAYMLLINSANSNCSSHHQNNKRK